MTDDVHTVSPSGVGRDLAAAEERLANLVHLVNEAVRSATQTERDIAAPVGLLTFADPNLLEQDGLGLAPWLADLAAAAGRGGRDADVAYGLAEWRTLAGLTEQAARTVVATNAAPREHRRELRGLLESVHQKAAQLGLAEDDELSALYARAHAVLHRAPTDLAEGEQLTMAYLHTLNKRDQTGRSNSGPGSRRGNRHTGGPRGTA